MEGRFHTVFTILSLSLFTTVFSIVQEKIPDRIGQRDLVSFQEKIPAFIGESVLVACGCPSSTVGIEWSRPEPRRMACFYRDGRSDPDAQHPSYKGRADCRNGTLHLKNVSRSDMGLYQCQCFRGGGEGSREPPHNISLYDQATAEEDATAGNTTAKNATSGYNTTEIILSPLTVIAITVPVVFIIGVILFIWLNQTKSGFLAIQKDPCETDEMLKSVSCLSIKKQANSQTGLSRWPSALSRGSA